MAQWGPTSNPRDAAVYPAAEHTYSNYGDSRSQSPLNSTPLSQSMTSQHGFSGTPSSSVYEPSQVPSYYNTPEHKHRDIFFESPSQASSSLFNDTQFSGYDSPTSHPYNGLDSYHGSPTIANGLANGHEEGPKVIFSRGGRPLTIDDARVVNFSPDTSKHNSRPVTNFSSPKKSHPKKSKKDVNRPKLTDPLSILTRDMITPPVRDMEAFVSRSAETRRAETAARKGKVARPMNSFMLYRSAYSERTKEWCREKNHQIVSTVMGESWVLESDEVKDWFGELAKREREEHQRVFPDYKFKPGKERMERNAREAADRASSMVAGRIENLHHHPSDKKYTEAKNAMMKKKCTHDDGYESDNVLDDLTDDWMLPGAKKRKMSAVPMSFTEKRNGKRVAAGKAFKTSPPAVIVGMKPLPLNFGITNDRNTTTITSTTVNTNGVYGGTTGSSPYFPATLSPVTGEGFKFEGVSGAGIPSATEEEEDSEAQFANHLAHFHRTAMTHQELGLVDPRLLTKAPLSPPSPLSPLNLHSPSTQDMFSPTTAAAFGFPSQMTPRKAGFHFDSAKEGVWGENGPGVFDPNWTGF